MGLIKKGIAKLKDKKILSKVADVVQKLLGKVVEELSNVKVTFKGSVNVKVIDKSNGKILVNKQVPLVGEFDLQGKK